MSCLKLLSLLSLLVTGLCLPAARAAAEQIAIIVSKPQAAETLNLAELARIYQRRRRFWSNGAKIVPFNLSADHPIRQQFSLEVFNSTPEDQREYWDTQYFHGVSPPYALASAEAVLQFVASTPGAIGYLALSAVQSIKTNEQVKVLMLLPPAAAP